MRKLTPIIIVDAIEPCLPFWTDALGFEVSTTVPHEDRLGFAILRKGGVELMYQTRASVAADLGEVGTPEAPDDEPADGNIVLFIEVEGIDSLLPSLEEAEVVVPRRTTFYGMDEVFVRSPCGTVVGFAARTAQV